jgi:Tfp pilus assembly protein PilN
VTEVNLLPPELRRRHRTRQLTMQVIAAAVVVVGLLVVLFLFESSRLASTNREIDAQKAQNAALQSQINDLQRFADLKDELTQRQALVTSLQEGTVAWSGVLHDLSMVIPGDVYLTSMSGSIQVSGTGTQESPTGLIGAIQFQGVATDHPAVALWLDRLVKVTGWSNSWVSSETKTEDTSTGTSMVNFSASVDLSAAVAQNGATP